MLHTEDKLTKVERAPRLVVYRASAGSGKTFTLATRFIELLIKDPKSYREILAVTFTVKATAEMKERILSQLYGLAHALPDSQSYLLQILSDLEHDHISISEDELRQRAARALQLILHDYSNFNVETIDSFFQRILRNLARELELNANLRVELNDTDIESLAVDRLITELKNNDEVLGWVMDFVKNKLADEKDWNVVNAIKDFGKKIFSHEYKTFSDAINKKIHEEGFFDNYQTSLRTLQLTIDAEMKKEGEDFFNLLEQNGYSPSDFQYGSSGAAAYFQKLIDDKFKVEKEILGKRVISAMNGVEGWVATKDEDYAKREFAEQVLVPLINRVETKRKECVKRYKSAEETLKHLNELRLLNNIEQTVKELNSDANCFLLSDTQTLLHNMMEGSDTPFVFEKIGGRISHIMIDEFQDTSTVQWNNFKKLLLECMAHANSENLIVGDVKQSIYRWRNSDWSLLNNIETDPDLVDKKLEPMVLDKNFRSEKNIVDFNNAFFALAPAIERATLEEDGNDNASLVEEIFSPSLTRQELPEEKEPHGLVDIQLLPAQNNEEFNPLCVALIQHHVHTLLDAGAQPNDIAILFRENKYATLVGDSLKKEFPDLTFVSDEAFQLSSSVAVNIVVGAMKVLCNERDLFVRAQLASDFHTYVVRDNAELLLSQRNAKEDINMFLPEEFVAREKKLRALPLNDMAEEICLIFNVETLSNESAYVGAFFDALNAFMQTNIPDLDNFVEYWDSVMFKKTVKGGDIQGIRLLTVHKAKGLEFDHVVLPFCNWQLDKGSTLWLEPTEEPFSALPVVPLDSKHLKDTIFAEAYHEEKLQTTVDNLNLLYVAFTRAKKNLFVIGKNVLKTKKVKEEIIPNGLDRDYRSGLLQAVLPSLASTLGATLTGDTNSKGDTLRLSYGSLYVKNAVKKTSDNIFLREKESHQIDMNFSPYRVEFRQSNSSREFVLDNAPSNEKFITKGTILHNVLSHIYRLADVDRVLSGFMEEGILTETDPEINKAEIVRLIRQRVENNDEPLVREWFSEDVDVLNECTILTKDPTTGQVIKQRPDRVVRQGDRVTVVDFKFANPKESHHTQVRTYMDLLLAMGHTNVRGYLWYGYTNKVVEVK